MLLVFTLTLFLSATLLFLVQPMVGKLILPFLGGTPAVWNTCMVFFQALLLAGYAYALVITARLGTRQQIALHLALLLVACVALPVGLTANPIPPQGGSPDFWLIGLLLLSIGLPFFVLSASAPL